MSKLLKKHSNLHSTLVQVQLRFSVLINPEELIYLIFEIKHSNYSYHDLLRKMILINEKHFLLHVYIRIVSCLFAKVLRSFAKVLRSFAKVLRNYAKNIFSPTKMSSMGFRIKVHFLDKFVCFQYTLLRIFAHGSDVNK